MKLLSNLLCLIAFGLGVAASLIVIAVGVVTAPFRR